MYKTQNLWVTGTHSTHANATNPLHGTGQGLLPGIVEGLKIWGRGQVVIGRHNLPPLVEIGLTDLWWLGACTPLYNSRDARIGSIL